MVRDLATPWEELRSLLKSTFERESEYIGDLMDDTMNYAGKSRRTYLPIFLITEMYADDQLQHSLELADTLGETMRSRQHLLLADLEEAYENFERDLRYVFDWLVKHSKVDMH
jgi:hypothetical protein